MLKRKGTRIELGDASDYAEIDEVIAQRNWRQNVAGRAPIALDDAALCASSPSESLPSEHMITSVPVITRAS